MTRSRSRVPAGPPPGSASVCRHPDRLPYVRRRVTGRRIRPVVQMRSGHEEAPLEAIVPSVRSPLPYRDSRSVDGTCPVRTTVAFRRAGALWLALGNVTEESGAVPGARCRRLQ